MAIGRIAQYCGSELTAFLRFVSRHTWAVSGLCAALPCITAQRFFCAVPRRFEERMTECFAIAISQGFKTIMVTPHIDNAVDAYQWRNYAVRGRQRCAPTSPCSASCVRACMHAHCSLASAGRLAASNAYHTPLLPPHAVQAVFKNKTQHCMQLQART